MNENSVNKSYNLLWKNIIIKKEVSSEYADKCINIFMNDDKKIYLYKKLCSEEDGGSCDGNTDNDNNIHIGLNFIKEALQKNGF
jgi:hypothetical protein